MPRETTEGDDFITVSQSFMRCLIQAQVMLARGDEPCWFREEFARGEAIQEHFKLPPQIPLIYALALHLWFEGMPKAVNSKQFKRELLADERSDHRSVKKGLVEVRERLLKLRRSAFVWPLEREVLDSWTSDGLPVLELGPDPVDEIVQAIDTFIMTLSAIRIERRKFPHGDAARLLERFVERNNPSLSSKQREELQQTVFAPICLRHGRHRRSRDGDLSKEPDEAPRFRDHLRRRPTKHRKSKSVKKLG